MRTSLRIKLSLLPVTFAGIALLTPWPLHGLAIALAAALARNLWLLRSLQWRPIELGLCLALALVVAGGLGPAPFFAQHPRLLLFAGLAVGAVVSLLIGRPWTSDFSAPDYPGAAETPVFHFVNSVISVLWAALFAWLAIAAALGLPEWMHWGVALAGGAVTAVLPRQLARLGRAIAIRRSDAPRRTVLALATLRCK
jgi:hypothetical protein